MSTPPPNKLKHLLIPLDGSHLAETVLPTAITLAKQAEADIILLHIVEEHAPSSIHGDRHIISTEEGQQYLESIQKQLQAEQISTNIHVHSTAEGDIARSIAAHAEELDADLIVLCAHGNGGIRGLLFGRIAQQALQQGHRPILMIPALQPDASGTAHIPKRILVPLDQRSSHTTAVPIAASLAQIYNATLHLVGVIPTLETLAGERAMAGMLLPQVTQEILALNEREIASHLEQIAQDYQAVGLTTSSEVLRGDPAPALIGCSQPDDWLALASHGRAGIAAWLAGSVASRIAERISLPLLFVKAIPE